MLNHFRTLLLNQTAPTTQTCAYPGDELIAPAYAQLTLPTYLTMIRRILFGSTPDRYMLNYRTRQLMNLIHTADLAEYVTAFDPRITYETDRSDFLSDTLYVPQVSQTSGTLDDRLTVLGQPEAPDRTGEMYYSFMVNILTESTVQITRLQGSMQQVIYDFETDTRLPLLGSGYRFRLNSTNPGAAWFIELLNRPQWDLGQIAVALESIGEVNTIQLFGLASAEPYKTFKNLWFTCNELPAKLSGLVLALGYRTEERRTSNA